MAVISKQYDITSLIERYARIVVVGHAVVRGIRENHSNCPWCGGVDRFVTRPETGQYTCAVRSKGCGRHGDGIDFLTEYAMMSWREALDELQIEEDSFKKYYHKPFHVSKEMPPNEKWQESGYALVNYAEKALWNTSNGRTMLDYLRARGLKDDTIKSKRFGYVPLTKNKSWYIGSFQEWGFDPDQLLPAQREKKGVRVPPGILIPWFEGNTLWRLSVKRPGQPKGKDYGQVLGSGEGMYNVDLVQYCKPAMIVESEICACSVEQEAGDLISCVATGSTMRARLMRWIAELSLASLVLQSFDEDQAGDEGSAYWEKTLKHSMRWSPMIAKDPNDLLRLEKDPASICTLRQWVEYGLDAYFNVSGDSTPPPNSTPTASIAPDCTPASVPNSSDDDLRIFANTVANIVDVLGGPQNVKIARHDPNKQQLPEYYPASLPCLPRSCCPHMMLQYRQVSSRVSKPIAMPCSGLPLEYGWCEDHKEAHNLLCILAQLGFPAIELGARGIEAGVENAELYACTTSQKHIQEDIARICARFGLTDH